MELTIEDRLDLVLAIPNNRLKRLGITEADLSRRDLLKRVGGVAATSLVPGGDVTKKLFDLISKATPGSAAAKASDGLFNVLLTSIGSYGSSWDEAVRDMADEDPRNLDRILDMLGMTRDQWRPDLLTPELAKAYLKNLADTNQFQAIGHRLYDEPEFVKLFGSTIKEILTKKLAEVGNFPSLFRSIMTPGWELSSLNQIEILKNYFPQLSKLIPFNTMDATSEQLKQIEKYLGRRLKTDWSRVNSKSKKRNKREDEKQTHKNDEPWISTGHEGGMHQPFESRLRKALGLKRLV